MGIFVEDLMHFGNLMDSEIPVDITAEDLKGVFDEIGDIEIRDGILKVSKREKRFFMTKEREMVLSLKGACCGFSLEFKVIRDDFNGRTGNELKVDIGGVLENKEIFQKIPKQVRNRMEIVRCDMREGFIRVHLKMRK